MKHLEFRQKYSATRVSTLFPVVHLVMKHYVSCLVYYVYCFVEKSVKYR